MKILVFSGIDGVGKTSIIEELMLELKKRNKDVSYIWMRFNHYFVKALNAIARVLRLSVCLNGETGEIWQHKFYKSKSFCRIYIICSFIDNYLAKSKVTRLRTEYIVCDRWVNDTLVDLGAECHIPTILDSKWYKLFNNLLPEHTVQFVVDRKLDSILESRIENRINPEFKFRYSLYKELEKKEGVVLIDNTGTIHESVQQILKHIY